MLRLSFATAFSTFATAASAHMGHVEPVAGHSHYVAFGALIIAAAIVAGLIVNTKRARNV